MKKEVEGVKGRKDMKKGRETENVKKHQRNDIAGNRLLNRITPINKKLTIYRFLTNIDNNVLKSR